MQSIWQNLPPPTSTDNFVRDRPVHTLRAATATTATATTAATFKLSRKANALWKQVQSCRRHLQTFSESECIMEASSKSADFPPAEPHVWTKGVAI
jgi:hypothetical protein